MVSAPVRAMAAADLPRVAELSLQLGYPVALAELHRRFERLARSPSDALFVAGEPVGGWIHLEHRESLESGESVEITGLVVDAARRREGLGRALVARAEQWALQRGVSRLRVRSNVTRQESHHFYPALGFARAKTQHVYERLIPLPRGEGGA